MKLHTFALAFALALVITGLCLSSIVWAHGAEPVLPEGRSLRIQTQGTAAARSRATLQVIKTLCGTESITWTQQPDASVRITCPLAHPIPGRSADAPPRYTQLDFSYRVNPPEPASAAAPSPRCDAATRVLIGGKTVLLRQGCLTEAAASTLTVNRPPALSTLNQGPVDRPWNTAISTSPLPLPRDTATASPAPKEGS